MNPLILYYHVRVAHKCNHLIGSSENIPLISWLFQKGCCKHCGCKISKRYPSIELLTGFMSLAVAFVVPFGWPLLFALMVLPGY